MNFKTKQKIIKMKKQYAKYCSNVWYTIMYPLTLVLDKYSDFKYKRLNDKVDSLTVQEASHLMAKYILKRLAERPHLVYELYVCESQYDSDECPSTAIDYILWELSRAKGKYHVLYKWGWKIHYKHLRKPNGIFLNDLMTGFIYDELYDIDGLEVYFEYDEELKNSIKGKMNYPNYQKHLVIKVKK